MDISKSIAYVEDNGTKLEIARMKHILYDIRPEQEDIRSFIELQNHDGGIPYDRKKGNLSANGVTLTILLWLDDLWMLESLLAVYSSKYFIETQHDDGSWDESPLIDQ
jgi:hypothetical protein